MTPTWGHVFFGIFGEAPLRHRPDLSYTLSPTPSAQNTQDFPYVCVKYVCRWATVSDGYAGVFECLECGGKVPVKTLTRLVSLRPRHPTLSIVANGKGDHLSVWCLRIISSHRLLWRHGFLPWVRWCHWTSAPTSRHFHFPQSGLRVRVLPK